MKFPLSPLITRNYRLTSVKMIGRGILFGGIDRPYSFINPLEELQPLNFVPSVRFTRNEPAAHEPAVFVFQKTFALSDTCPIR